MVQGYAVVVERGSIKHKDALERKLVREAKDNSGWGAITCLGQVLDYTLSSALRVFHRLFVK